MASKEKNSTKLNKLNYLLYFAILLLFITLCVYFYNFKNGLSNESSNWGTFGDFVGGTLNPIFALFSLFAIIYTIKIQTEELEFSREELEATREELKGSRIAQQEQSESLKLQNEATKLQIFENTFFKLFELHNDKYEKFKNKLDSYNNRIFENNESSDETTYMLNKFNMHRRDYLYTYLLTLFELLIFIDKEDSKNTNLYIGLVKASVNNGYILTYIALECMSNNNLKSLIEKYSLLESLNLIGRNRQTEICLILNDFDKSAFGLNEELIEMLSFSKHF